MHRSSNSDCSEKCHSASVSVVIAHFNGEATIREALVSLTSQEVPPDEIIVVDDGSSASSLAQLRSLKIEFGFKLLELENAGQSAARNSGVALAEHPLVAFLDQDDVVLQSHLKVLKQEWCSRSNNYSFCVFGDAWRRVTPGLVVQRSSVRKDLDLSCASLAQLLMRDLMVTPGQMLIAKEHFLAIGGFDPSLRGYEDDDLIIRASLAGFEFLESKAAVVGWTFNISSTSFSDTMSESRHKFMLKWLPTVSDPIISQINGVTPEAWFTRRFLGSYASDILLSSLNGAEKFLRAKTRLWDAVKTVSSANLAFTGKKIALNRTSVFFLRAPRLLLSATLGFVVDSPNLAVRIPILGRILSRYLGMLNLAMLGKRITRL